MKKYLLPENGSFYKANLHCHTTVSDGKLTPEEVKEEYMARGYSVVAYTDHRILVPHPELCDEGFVALNGYEFDALDDKRARPINHVKTCHVCLVATSPDLTEIPNIERVYTPENITALMNTGRESGFFVTYNHPAWSLEDLRDYSQYHGLHAVEMYNYSSYVSGMNEYNTHVYDEILREGERIYCIGADDNHNDYPLDSPKSDSFGAFTLIKAEKLEYEAITSALLAGSFYASRGPVINALWLEDGEIHIECEDSAEIIFNTNGRRRFSVYPEEGKPLTAAAFKLLDEDIYVRVTVVDKEGKTANTNAYFLDEIVKM